MWWWVLGGKRGKSPPSVTSREPLKKFISISSSHEPLLSAQLQTCSCRLSSLSQLVLILVFFMLPQQEISGVIQDLKRVERQLLGVDVMQSVTHKY